MARLSTPPGSEVQTGLAVAAPPFHHLRMETRIIRAGTGEIMGPPAGCRDRFLVDSKSWGGHLGVVEHLPAPHSIAAPMHRHSREDEFSFILEGRVWAQFGDEEHVAEGGDLVFKPRGEWHTFWNASEYRLTFG